MPLNNPVLDLIDEQRKLYLNFSIYKNIKAMNLRLY